MALVALMPMIEQQLKEKNIAIILGDTGMGKSTVVPQELLKIFPKKAVMMVEKRRVAARELSKFMQTSLGNKSGYSIGGESQNLDTAKVLYVTDAMLWKKGSLDKYKKHVVVLDECMKDDINTHINFALGKRIAALGGYVVLLGAGIPDEVRDYMGLTQVTAEARGLMFDVPVKYCGDLTGCVVSQVKRVVAQLVQSGVSGAILVFLPGLSEIEECVESSPPGTVSLPLYGKQNQEEGPK